MRKAGAIDFDDRHVHLAIQANQLGVQQFHFRLKRRGAAQSRTTRKPDLDAPGALDHVRVGDNESVVGEDDPGAGAALPGEQRGCVARVGFVGCHVAGGEDLHHGGTHSTDQPFERHAEFAQRDRRGYGTWRSNLGWRDGFGILSLGRQKSKEQSEERQREFSHTFIFSYRKRTGRRVRPSTSCKMQKALIAESLSRIPELRVVENCAFPIERATVVG